MKTDLPLLRDCLSEAGGAWNRFFHGSCDARILAIVRIAAGVLLVAYWAVLYPDLTTWFGEEGLYPRRIWLEERDGRSWSLFAWDWLGGDLGTLQVCLWISLAQSVLLAVGFLPRVQAAGLLVWLVSWQNRNPLLLDGEDVVFRLLTCLLIFADSGRVWSVNQFLYRGIIVRYPDAKDPDKAGEIPQAAMWPLRLIQVQMCVIFFAAGICKLGSEAWLSGEAFYYVARLHDYFGRFPVPTAVTDWPFLVRLATWATIAVEIGGPVLLWFKETRRPALLAIVAFHLACDYSMHLFLFHWVMLAGWLAFVTSEDLRWGRTATSHPPPQGKAAV